MDLEDVAAFVTAVDNGGLAAAARIRGEDRSNVGRRIARLERALGITLLSRTPRAIALTREGRTFLAKARTLIEAAAAARRAVKEDTENPVRITAPISFGQRLLAPALGRLRAEHPSIRIDLDLASAHKDPDEHPIDIAIRIGDVVKSDLIVSTLGRIRFALVASPSYLVGRRRISTPEDLSAGDLIGLWRPDRPNVMTLTRDGRSQSATFTPSVMVNDAEAAAAAACGGAGIARVPLFVAAPYFANKSLVQVLRDWSLPTARVAGIHQRRTDLSVPVRLTLDFLRASLRAEPALRSPQSGE